MPSPIIGINSLYDRVEKQAAHVRTQLEMISGDLSIHKAQEPENKENSASQSRSTINEEQAKNKGAEAGGDQSARRVWLNNLSVIEPQQKIEACRHEHTRLKHRLIKALGRLERLQTKSKSGGRTKPEIEFDQRLRSIADKLEDPRGCRSQLISIVTQMELNDFQDPKLSLSSELQLAGSNFEAMEQDQAAIFNFLELQREGIDSLMKIVRKDLRDLEIMRNKLKESNTASSQQRNF
jgi:hypothetical protein